jgi:ABC-type branched-subunit amino acid transport system permease subunit
MIPGAILVFVLGFVVIRSLQRHAAILTVILSVAATVLLFECAQMATAENQIETPHWDPALEIFGR